MIIAITTIMIIHFRIVHAIFPIKPRIIKITAITSRRINRLIIVTNTPFKPSLTSHIYLMDYSRPGIHRDHKKKNYSPNFRLPAINFEVNLNEFIFHASSFDSRMVS